MYSRLGWGLAEVPHLFYRTNVTNIYSIVISTTGIVSPWNGSFQLQSLILSDLKDELIQFPGFSSHSH